MSLWPGGIWVYIPGRSLMPVLQLHIKCSSLSCEISFMYITADSGS